MDKKEARILYLGTPEISANVLESLLENGYNIIGVVAQEDKETDRKGRLLEVPTKKIAKKYDIPVYQFHKIKEHFDDIEKLSPDIILTMAYGRIISENILKIPSIGSYNLHGSLLPKYRGAAPIQYSLLNGDNKTGVTLMEMVKEMDAGKMFYKDEFEIEEEDNYSSLQKKISVSAFNAFDNGIQDIMDGKNLGLEQNALEVTFTSKITADLEKINFNNEANHIKNIVRALSDTPGTYFVYKNDKYKVFKVKDSKDNKPHQPGRIQKYDKNGFEIETSDGYISILSIQKPGKKMMNFKDFYNGNQNLFVIGDII